MVKRTLTRWLPVVFWASIIFYLSAQPDLRITQNQWDFLLRKCAHMFFFGVLFLLTYRALGFRNMRIAFCLAVGYAISDELHQRFVAGRHGAPTDVLIDTAGMIVVALLWNLSQKQLTKRNP